MNMTNSQGVIGSVTLILSINICGSMQPKEEFLGSNFIKQQVNTLFRRKKKKLITFFC